MSFSKDQTEAGKRETMKSNTPETFRSVGLVLFLSVLGLCWFPSATFALDGQPGGIDLSQVEVCSLIPQEMVAKICGPLRESRETTIIDREKGCLYVNKAGLFFEITYIPLDRWGLVQYTMKEPVPIENVGDGGFQSSYPDALMVRILAKGRAVIEIRSSDDKMDTALALYFLALEHLPQH